MISQKKYWDKINIDYSKNWDKTKAKMIMSNKELSFINDYLKNVSGGNILDVGVGTGRIIKNILDNTNKNINIYGIDISDEMISICKTKFDNNERIISLKQCDIGKDNLDFQVSFDFITAIRVIKYSKNWKEIIKKINSILKKDGVFVLTMSNKYSINFFHNGELPAYRTSIGEFKKVASKSGFKIMKIESYSKLPDFFYICSMANNNLYVKLIYQIEKILNYLLGNKLFGRILFIALKKV